MWQVKQLTASGQTEQSTSFVPKLGRWSCILVTLVWRLNIPWSVISNLNQQVICSFGNDNLDIQIMVFSFLFFTCKTTTCSGKEEAGNSRWSQSFADSMTLWDFSGLDLSVTGGSGWSSIYGPHRHGVGVIQQLDSGQRRSCGKERNATVADASAAKKTAEVHSFISGPLHQTPESSVCHVFHYLVLLRWSFWTEQTGHRTCQGAGWVRVLSVLLVWQTGHYWWRKYRAIWNISRCNYFSSNFRYFRDMTVVGELKTQLSSVWKRWVGEQHTQ